MFFYFIYLLINFFTWGQTMQPSTRNCTILLLGVIIYVIALTFLKYFAEIKDNKIFSLIFHGFLVVLIADVGVMFYLYKSKYGRDLLAEFDNPNTWNYNYQTNQYTKKTDVEIEFENWKNNVEIEKQVAKIDLDIEAEKYKNNVEIAKQVAKIDLDIETENNVDSIQPLDQCHNDVHVHARNTALPCKDVQQIDDSSEVNHPDSSTADSDVVKIDDLRFSKRN